MALGIIIGIIAILVLYLILKPYFIKYHTTLLLTGELGAGKTMEGVKTAVRVYKKTLLGIKFHNWIINKRNKIRHKYNKKAEKYNLRINSYIEQGIKKKHLKFKTYKEDLKLQPIPRLISNIPIRIKGGKNEQWSNVLEEEMLTMERDTQGFIKKIPEYSVVLIDETPQLVDQYNWNLSVIQNNINEWITFYRHYINGLLILTAQSDSQIVKQIREKMSQFYWLMNFRKFLFFFYKFDVVQFVNSDVVSNVNVGFIEDNAKTRYGILKKGLYDSRCYSIRYTEEPEYKQWKRWSQYKTKHIIRFDKKYHSPLDRKPQ